AVGVDDHSRRAVAIGGIDVGVEEVDGFEHVSIGVDHVVRACHGRKYRPARTMPAGGPAMLSREENELITRAAPGMPMGDTMRRYWIPALMARELPAPDCPPVRVRLLGEDLVAFRDSEGRIGLLDEYCPHRRV